MIELTKKQQEAVNTVVKRFKQNETHTIIAGYAGTGKTTCIKNIVEALVQQCGILRERICIAAYTGKAAQVLINKGHKNVITLHKLLYNNKLQENGGYEHKLKKDLLYSVVIVDEISMVSKQMLQQLNKKAMYIIGIGDPFQLPPVKGESDVLLQQPHVFLDEVTRQAAKSPIIQLSMQIRNKEPIPYTKNDEVQVLPKSELTTGMLLWADQIICATNKTRDKVNKKMRELLDKKGEIDEGDKVICLSNYWDKTALGNSDYALTNGVTGIAKNIRKSGMSIPPEIRDINIHQRYYSTIKIDFTTETGQQFNSLCIDKDTLKGEKYGVETAAVYRLKKNKKFSWKLPFEFTYGYCITAHKSQGSEWDKVLVLEEKYPYDKEQHAHWLYTAITRAKKKLVLIK